jgi:hypothetical protein
MPWSAADGRDGMLERQQHVAAICSVADEFRRRAGS